ncbi:hypothetical protein BDD41_2681 [Paracoccus versutus]|uniref:N-acetyltransferase domain-containing protein n=2 Tax=Paracoccus versutus TaxID=34007 RepID=A0A3D9XP67_PARVE|nr:hypothetical protein BDD41_2681 [Paracoccus versutus]
MGAGELIRPAGMDDIPRVIDLIEKLAATVNGLPVDRIKAGETLAGLICDPAGVVLVTGGGFIAGRIGDTFISRDLVAYELGWFAEDRSGLRLLRAFETWAQGRGAAMIAMSCNGGAAQRILERSGYRVAEIQMVK